MKILSSLFLALSTTFAYSATWELNDVSILFPLPKEKDGSSFLLKTSDSGKNGRLFPLNQREVISGLIIGFDRPEPDDIYESVRAVGMRIDPCFKFTALPMEKCHPQLRIVWQPTAGLGSKNATTFDGAIHSFYALSNLEFSALKKDLQNLKFKNAKYKVSTAGKPLHIHPAFLNNSRRHSFNNELKEIILKYAGEKKLVRFTFMKLLTNDLWWEFGGRDLNPAGFWTHTEIPKLDKNQDKQEFFNEESFKPTAMRGTVLPDVEGERDNLKDLIPGYGMRNLEVEKQLMKEGITSINRIENPNIHHPATLDCVHCHIAEPTKIWMEKEKSETLKKVNHSQAAYIQDFIGRHNLTNVTNDKSHNKSLRAFGYYKNRPSINQRAINETASVADFLNKSGD